MAWDKTALLSIKNLFVAINKKRLLHDISFDIQPGEIIALIGRNGAGKSTLLNTIAGEHNDYQGNITFGNQAYNQWSLSERAKHLAVLPQFSHLAFPYCVYDVVALGRVPHASGNKIDNDIVNAALSQFDIAHLSGQLYTQLSGGEKQRVQLARVFCQIWHSEDATPRLLLLDEPLNSLDLSHQQQLMSAIKSHAESGTAVIMVLHDINMAIQHAHKLLALTNGAISHFDEYNKVITPTNLQTIFSIDAKLITDDKTGQSWVTCS